MANGNAFASELADEIELIDLIYTIYNYCTRGELTELLLLTDLEDNNCSMTQRKIPIQTRTNVTRRLDLQQPDSEYYID